jgi:dTMP kinase
MRGAFITLEGIEGVGKSTNVEFAAATLRAAGKNVLVTREPGGTALGEKIRHWILHEEHGALSAEIEILLMFAARAQHLEQIIRPALAAGTWVVCDRFTDATIAYQGGGRGGELRLIESLRSAVQRGVDPDLTILLDAPVAVSVGRIAARDPDHFEREAAVFFERVRQAYLGIAAREPQRLRVIDAAQPLDEVQRRIRAELDTVVARFSG